MNIIAPLHALSKMGMNFKRKAPSKINIDNSMEWKKSKRASSGCSEAIPEKVETG